MMRSITSTSQGRLRLSCLARLLIISFAVLLTAPVASASSIRTACDRFFGFCDQACYERGVRSDPDRACFRTGNLTFSFGCYCLDNFNVSTQALQDFAGYEKVKKINKGTTTVRTSSTSYTFSYSVTTPVVTSLVPGIYTSLTATTGTSTVYQYSPKSHSNGDPPARHAKRSTISDFCGAFTQVCKGVCKDSFKAKRPLKNTCVKKDYGSFKLDCTCSKGSQSNVDVLNAFKNASLAPSGTTTRTGLKVVTKSHLTTKSSVIQVTAAPSTSTSYFGTTIVKTAGAAVVTSQVPLTGRIRVDRLDRDKPNDLVGYYAVGEYFGKYEHLNLTTEPSDAAPVTLDLAKSDLNYNVYAIKWSGPEGTYWASWRANQDDEADGLGGSKGGCGDAEAQWLKARRPLGPLMDQQTEGCNPDFPDYDDDCPSPIQVETYTWTLNATQPNELNPERKLQIPLRPFWLTARGAIFRPAVIYFDGGPSYPEGSNIRLKGSYSGYGCSPKGSEYNYDVAHFFEPDAPKAKL